MSFSSKQFNEEPTNKELELQKQQSDVPQYLQHAKPPRRGSTVVQLAAMFVALLGVALSLTFMVLGIVRDVQGHHDTYTTSTYDPRAKDPNQDPANNGNAGNGGGRNAEPTPTKRTSYPPKNPSDDPAANGNAGNGGGRNVDPPSENCMPDPGDDGC